MVKNLIVYLDNFSVSSVCLEMKMVENCCDRKSLKAVPASKAYEKELPKDLAEQNMKIIRTSSEGNLPSDSYGISFLADFKDKFVLDDCLLR